MGSWVTIFGREFKAYFNSPIAYVYMIVFLLMTAGLFMSTFFLAGVAGMRGYFAVLPLFLTIFIPCLTMRLWAEERKLGTISLLLSFPVRSGALVWGKFAGALVFFLMTLACTLTVPVVIALAGNPDWGSILAGYLGAVLVGGLFLSVGMFISALVKDQIVAFILSILVCFAMAMLGLDFVAAFLDGWVGGLGQVLQKSLGVTRHTAAFERGVIDLGGVLFFLSFSAVLLVLNAFTLDTRIKLRSTSRFYVAVVLLVGVGILLNLVLSDVRLKRIDLTEGRLYTVSPATERILARLQTPVEVNYYVTEKEKMPSVLKNLRQDVEDKLSDLGRLSPNFRYRIHNPLADESKLDELEQKGIAPFQARTIEQDSFGIQRVYSAISITYLDRKTEVLPQVVPQNLGTLEYDLVSKIYRMTLEQSPRISMLAPMETEDLRYSDPRMRQLLMQLGQTPPQMQDHYRGIMQALRMEGYQVNRISLSENEPLVRDTATLIVIEPKELNDRQLFEVQRFLAQGGNVIVSAQSHEYTYAPVGGAGISVTPVPTPGSVNRLIEPYGVRVDPGILMDEQMEILNVQVPRRIGGVFNAMVSTPVKLPIQLRLGERDLNRTDPMTNRIGALLYLWGSSLVVNRDVFEKLGLRWDVLAESSPLSWTIEGRDEALGPEDLLPPATAGRGPKVLAVKLEGRFPDLHAGKPAPPWPGEESSPDSEAPPQGEAETAAPVDGEPGRLVIVGCSKMFSDSVIGAMDNRLFFQNLVDGVTLSEDLIGIRTKGQTIRLLEDLTAGRKLAYRFLAVALVPLLLAGAGVGRFVIRRRRRERYERNLAASIRETP